ncbi:uncharacterized protein LOC128951480 [Oppia nitens]|uniref:uncharacterized protein LOC128951480 n=1 Tax=Oppia nitens TaxID=1686743 RepID=UPI0023DA4F66|nr:uncharacterized protein LOC128951480 [Oppia nitens]
MYKYKQLIDATDNYVKNLKLEQQEIKSNLKDINKLKDLIETTIKNIPETIDAPTEMTNYVNIFGLKLWERKFKTFIKEANPHKDSDKQYYQNVISVLADQIKDNKKKDYNHIVNELENKKADYSKQLETTEFNLDKLSVDLPGQVEKINIEINKLYNEIEDLEKDSLEAYTKYGLKGSAFVECLIKVRTVSKCINEEASIYLPLENILTRIQLFVKMHIDYLCESETKYDIFIAGQMLIRKVEFLSHYNVMAVESKLYKFEPPYIIPSSMTKLSTI